MFETATDSFSGSVRTAGIVKHLGIGRAHARTEIICLVQGHTATVITHDGDALAEFVIHPEKGASGRNVWTGSPSSRMITR